jgi:hypothetical protein
MDGRVGASECTLVPRSLSPTIAFPFLDTFVSHCYAFPVFLAFLHGVLALSSFQRHHLWSTAASLSFHVLIPSFVFARGNIPFLSLSMTTFMFLHTRCDVFVSSLVLLVVHQGGSCIDVVFVVNTM